MLIAAHQLEGLPYEIEWAEFPAAQHLLEAIAAGAVDVGLTGDAPFQFAYQSGGPLKVVQVMRSDAGVASTAILVPGGSVARHLADLKGKRIATGRGSIGHYLLLLALEHEALRVSDIDAVFLPPGDAKAAFSSGAIDAWSTWNPYLATALLHDGARVLRDGRGLLTGVGFMVANAVAIGERRALLADFLARNARAQRWVAANPAAYADVLARETGLPLDVARYTAERGRLGPVAVDDALLAQQRDLLVRFRSNGTLAGVRPIEEAFDVSLYRPERTTATP